MRVRIFLTCLALFCLGLSENFAFGSDAECKQGPAVLSLVQKVGAETLTCLDSVTTGGLTRAVLLGQSSLIVIDVSSNGGGNPNANPKVLSQVRISDPTLFPHGCGHYLMGARVLPGAAKIAALYGDLVVRLIDFNDPKNVSVTVGIDNPFHPDAYTCEGYFPNWTAGRGMWDPDRLKVDAQQRLVLETYPSDKSIEQVTEKKLNATEQAFYSAAYNEECTGSLSDPASQACKDLEQATDQGVYVTRDLFTPKLTAKVSY